jgi:hypothetical protein
MADHGRSWQITADHGMFWRRAQTALTHPSSYGSMISDPRHRELLRRAIDAQTVVADELQSAFNARMALVPGHPQRLETVDLFRDWRALETLISGAHDLLTGKASAVTLHGGAQP